MNQRPRIIVPYIYRYPPTEEALAWWPDPITWYEVDRNRAYLDLIQGLFKAGRDVIICEHDVVPLPAQLVSLVLCDRDWCCYPERPVGHGGWGSSPSFSLVRFRRSFLDANATVWDRLSDTRRAAGVYQEPWTMLDSWLVGHAQGTCHLHGPPWVDNQRPLGALH